MRFEGKSLTLPETMLAFLTRDLFDYQYWLSSPIAWLGLLFQIWMLVDAIRREEWFWAILIFMFSVITAALYFFLVYRQAPAVSAPGRIELPGAGDRKRIRELETQIHHLDKPHHYSELGEIHLRRGRLQEAERCFKAAMERDPADIDYQALLGQTFFEQERLEEALPLLEKVVAANPRHSYGHSAVLFAETLSRLGQKERAIEQWNQVLEHYTYPRARVQLAELLLEQGATDQARALLQEVVSDHQHAAGFQKKIDREWIKRARRMLAHLPP